MANELRVWDNLVGGLVEDNPLLAAATTLTSAGLAALRAIDTTNHAVVVFNPDGRGNAPFAKRVTAHTLGATTATIEATALWGTAVDVPQDTPWVHAVLAEDVQSPVLTRALSSPANVLGIAAGATTTIVDTVVTSSGFRGRFVDAWFFTTAYGATGTSSMAGTIEMFDVTNATSEGVSRFHTNGLERQMQVGVYAKLLVLPGLPITLRVRANNDAGSGQALDVRDSRLTLYYTEL